MRHFSSVGHWALMGAADEQHERIDLIDVDRAVFVDNAPRPGINWSQVVLKAVGLLAVLAVAIAVWWPEPPEWRVFKPAPVPVAGLTDELVLDDPPGQLIQVELPPAPTGVRPELGYVFGEPYGRYLTRRWALFRTRTSSLQSAPQSTTLATVNGVGAKLRRVRVRREVEWGPIDGRTWRVTTNMLDESQALEFANQVGLVDGLPALRTRYDLGDMVPIGSVAAFDCVVLLTDLFHDEHGTGAAQPTLLRWGTPEDPVSLGSIAVPSDALPMVEFVLGAGEPTTVHSQPAVMIKSRVLADWVIGWVEDGRLILVAGNVSPEELLALAETVRPATDDEWAEVVLASQTPLSIPLFPVDTTSVNFGDNVTLYEGVDPETGATFSFSAQISGKGLLMCINEQSDVGSTGSCGVEQPSGLELPLLWAGDGEGHSLVLAVVERGLGEDAELRITLADGTIETFPLIDHGEALPGPAVATVLPADHGAVELWIGEKVVATL